MTDSQKTAQEIAAEVMVPNGKRLLSGRIMDAIQAERDRVTELEISLKGVQQGGRNIQAAMQERIKALEDGLREIRTWTEGCFCLREEEINKPGGKRCTNCIADALLQPSASPDFDNRSGRFDGKRQECGIHRPPTPPQSVQAKHDCNCGSENGCELPPVQAEDGEV